MNLNPFSKKRMGIQKFVLPFNGEPHFWVEPSVSGYCGVEIDWSAHPVTVTITEPEMFYGLSVSNAFEAIATQIYEIALQGKNPRRIRFIHHELASIGGKEITREVKLKWHRKYRRYFEPQWERATMLGDFRIHQVDFAANSFGFTLNGGREVRIPYFRYPILSHASDKQRANYDIEFSGTVIHWKDLGFRLPVREAYRQADRLDEGSELVVPLSMIQPPLLGTA